MLRPLREGDIGLRQSQHAHPWGVPRGVPAGGRAGLWEVTRLLSHAETRQLAERRRMRTELPDQPMFERPPDRRTGTVAKRNRDLGRQDERQATRRRPAIQDHGRPHEVEATISRD